MSIANFKIYTTAGNFTGVEGEPPNSLEYKITSLKLYPNPFKSKVNISYTLKAKSVVKVKVYNINGELVKTIDKGLQTEGQYKLAWDGRNETGAIVSGGCLFYSVKHEQ